MALTNIEKVRLQTGDRVEPYFIDDYEIESYLEMYGGNVRRASMQVAQAILFQLASNPSVYRERTGEEEVFTADAFKSYKEALLLYIKYPHQFLTGVMPYCAGLTKSDAHKYTSDRDKNPVGTNLPKNSNTVQNIEDNILPYNAIPLSIIEP